MHIDRTDTTNHRLRTLWQRADVRWVRVALGSGLSLLTLWLAFRDVPLAEVLAVFARVHYGFVALAAGLVLVSPLLRAARWRLLFHPHQEELQLFRLAEALLIGQMLNIVVPARLGELARIYFIGRRGDRSRARTLGTIAVEKWLDILMLLLLALLVPLFVTLPIWFRDARVTLGALAMVVLIGALAISRYQDRLVRLMRRASKILPRRWQVQMEEAVGRALGSLGVFRNLGVTLRLQAWSLLTLFLSVLVNYVVFQALGMSLPFAAALFLLAVLEVGVAVPSAPGKLGVFHYLCILALGVFGVGKGDAIAYAVLLHVVVFLPPSLLGALFLWWESLPGQAVSSNGEEGAGEATASCTDRRERLGVGPFPSPDRGATEGPGAIPSPRRKDTDGVGSYASTGGGGPDGVSPSTSLDRGETESMGILPSPGRAETRGTGAIPSRWEKVAEKSGSTVASTIPSPRGERARVRGQPISVIIPTCGARRDLAACLQALEKQTEPRHTYELIVVFDGPADPSFEAAFDRSEVGKRVLAQPRSGAAAARNLGAAHARGDLLLFIDADCIAEPDWIEAMTAPFADATVVGVGGRVCSHQSGLVPRYVQLEYDRRYQRIAAYEHIDFVSTAAAAYRRGVFHACEGFDETLRGAEDMEFSYRLAGLGHRMVFAPQAVVYHRHPTSLWTYTRRKAHYGFWRMAVYGKHPDKAVADSRTPQTQKLQIGLLCLLALALLGVPFWGGFVWLAGALIALFLVLALPFWWWVFRRDVTMGLLTPFFLFVGTAGAAAGVTAGMVKRWLRLGPGGRKA